MDEKTLVLGLLTKTLNKSDEELADLLYQKADDGSETLKDESLDVVLDLIEKKISKVKGAVDEKKLRDEGYSRAKKEVMTNFENEIKEHYELETEKTGTELIEDLVNKFKVDDSKLTPDKIKLSDTYRARERELRKEIKDLQSQFESEKETILSDFKKKETWSNVSREIGKRLDEVNPVLPKNPKAASNLKELFINSFADYEWQVDSEGKPFPTKEGKRVEDNLGNEIDFDVLISGRIPEYFDIQVQDKKGGAGNTGGGQSGIQGVPNSFKDDADYLKYVNGEPDVNKRIAAKKVYEAQQSR